MLIVSSICEVYDHGWLSVITYMWATTISLRVHDHGNRGKFCSHIYPLSRFFAHLKHSIESQNALFIHIEYYENKIKRIRAILAAIVGYLQHNALVVVVERC